MLWSGWHCILQTAVFAVLRSISPQSLTYLSCLKGGVCNEKADEYRKEGFHGTGGSRTGGSYNICSECLLPLVRTACGAEGAERPRKQQVMKNGGKYETDYQI